MKKALLISLVTVLAVSLVGCNNNEDVDKPNVNQGVSGEVENNNNQENEIPELTVSGDVESGETGSGELGSGEENVKSDLELKIDSLVQKSNVAVRMPMPMPISSESSMTYLGLTEAQFNENVKSAIAYESMIRPSNFSLCLVETKEGANVAEVKRTIIDNCDLNKWICAFADKAMVVDSGNYIMLVMSTAEDCDALQKAFADDFVTIGDVLYKDNAEENI